MTHENIAMTEKEILKMEETLTNIANKTLHLETLETRMCDRLDFRELSVWSIKEALETAYKAGRNNKEGDNLR